MISKKQKQMQNLIDRNKNQSLQWIHFELTNIGKKDINQLQRNMYKQFKTKFAEPTYIQRGVFSGWLSIQKAPLFVKNYSNIALNYDDLKQQQINIGYKSKKINNQFLEKLKLQQRYNQFSNQFIVDIRSSLHQNELLSLLDKQQIQCWNLYFHNKIQRFVFIIKTTKCQKFIQLANKKKWTVFYKLTKTQFQHPSKLQLKNYINYLQQKQYDLTLNLITFCQKPKEQIFKKQYNLKLIKKINQYKKNLNFELIFQNKNNAHQFIQLFWLQLQQNNKTFQNTKYLIQRNKNWDYQYDHFLEKRYYQSQKYFNYYKSARSKEDVNKNQQSQPQEKQEQVQPQLIKQPMPQNYRIKILNVLKQQNQKELYTKLKYQNQYDDKHYVYCISFENKCFSSYFNEANLKKKYQQNNFTEVQIKTKKYIINCSELKVTTLDCMDIVNNLYVCPNIIQNNNSKNPFQIKIILKKSLNIDSFQTIRKQIETIQSNISDNANQINNDNQINNLDQIQQQVDLIIPQLQCKFYKLEQNEKYYQSNNQERRNRFFKKIQKKNQNNNFKNKQSSSFFIIFHEDYKIQLDQIKLNDILPAPKIKQIQPHHKFQIVITPNKKENKQDYHNSIIQSLEKFPKTIQNHPYVILFNQQYGKKKE